MLSYDLEDRFDRATEFLDEQFRDAPAQSGFDLSGGSEISYVRLLITLHSGIETRFTDAGGVFYVIEEQAAGQLVGAAHSLPEAAAVLKEVCASNTFEGMPLPYSLRCAVSTLVRGELALAKRRGPALTGEFVQRWLLREAALYTRDAFGLDLTRHDGPTTMSACDAVVQVAARHNIAISFGRLRDWCTHKDYLEMRNRADALTNYLKDGLLREWGLLRPSDEFGVFPELSRMRR